MDNFKTRVTQAQVRIKAPKNQRNSFGNYNYRSCEDILEAAKPICNELHLLLTLTDTVKLIGDRYYIEATARLDDTESDEFKAVTASARESDSKKGMDDSQVTGTASSYARKYALNGLFDIDDTKDADTDEFKKNTDKGNGKDGKSDTTQNNAPEIANCVECKGVITPWIVDGKTKMTASGVIDYTIGKYGVPLCLECAKKRKNANQ